MILVKAPYDNKNLLTDFLTDDFGGINDGGDTWLMFIEGQPVMCTVIDNRLHFKALRGDKSKVLNYLKQYFENTEEIEHVIRVVEDNIIVKSYFVTY